jgi:hypothetical protein
MTTTFVRSAQDVSALIDNLVGLKTNSPSIYMSVIGNLRSRQGPVSIITILVDPKEHYFLMIVGLQNLDASAFTIKGNRHGTTTLQAILEDGNTPKVFFDIEAPSKALFAYNVSIRGVHDLQIMEKVMRNTSGGSFL